MTHTRLPNSPGGFVGAGLLGPLACQVLAGQLLGPAKIVRVSHVTVRGPVLLREIQIIVLQVWQENGASAP
jgi:hypothetical protein